MVKTGKSPVDAHLHQVKPYNSALMPCRSAVLAWAVPFKTVGFGGNQGTLHGTHHVRAYVHSDQEWGCSNIDDVSHTRWLSGVLSVKRWLICTTWSCFFSIEIIRTVSCTPLSESCTREHMSERKLEATAIYSAWK